MRPSRASAPRPGTLNITDDEIAMPVRRNVVPAITASTEWDGASIATLCRWLDMEHVRNSLPSMDVRNRPDAKKHISTQDWTKLIRAAVKMIRKILPALCKHDAKTLEYDVGRALSGSTTDTTSVVATLYTLYNNSKNASLEKRGFGAVLSSALNSRRLVMKTGVDVDVPLVKGFGSTQLARGLRDATTIQAGKALTKTIIRRKRFDENIVREALLFLLSEDFIGVLSWGVKKVKLTKGIWV